MHNSILPRVLESGAPNIKVPASRMGCLCLLPLAEFGRVREDAKKERSKRK